VLPRAPHAGGSIWLYLSIYFSLGSEAYRDGRQGEISEEPINYFPLYLYARWVDEGDNDGTYIILDTSTGCHRMPCPANCDVSFGPRGVRI